MDNEYILRSWIDRASWTEWIMFRHNNSLHENRYIDEFESFSKAASNFTMLYYLMSRDNIYTCDR